MDLTLGNKPMMPNDESTMTTDGSEQTINQAINSSSTTLPTTATAKQTSSNFNNKQNNQRFSITYLLEIEKQCRQYEREKNEIKELLFSMKHSMNILENINQISKEYIQTLRLMLTKTNQKSSKFSTSTTDQINFLYDVDEMSKFLDDYECDLNYWNTKYESMNMFNIASGNEEKIRTLLLTDPIRTRSAGSDRTKQIKTNLEHLLKIQQIQKRKQQQTNQINNDNDMISSQDDDDGDGLEEFNDQDLPPKVNNNNDQEELNGCENESIYYDTYSSDGGGRQQNIPNKTKGINNNKCTTINNSDTNESETSNNTENAPKMLEIMEIPLDTTVATSATTTAATTPDLEHQLSSSNVDDDSYKTLLIGNNHGKYLPINISNQQNNRGDFISPLHLLASCQRSLSSSPIQQETTSIHKVNNINNDDENDVGGAHRNNLTTSSTNTSAQISNSIHASGLNSKENASSFNETQCSDSLTNDHQAISKSLFQCDYHNCHFQTNSRQRLTMHRRYHSGETLYHCDVADCGYFSNYKGNIKIHKKHRHRVEFLRSVDGTGSQGPTCNSFRVSYRSDPDQIVNQELLFNNANNLNSDEQQELTTDLVNKQQDQQYLGPRTRGRKRLYDANMDNNNDGDQPGTDAYQASLSNYVVNSIVPPFKEYECKVDGCSYKSKWKQCLTAHEFLHNGLKPFKCDYPGCNYRTNFKGNVNVHKKQHRLNIFHCEKPDCSFSTPWKNSYLIHQRNHQYHHLKQQQQRQQQQIQNNPKSSAPPPPPTSTTTTTANNLDGQMNDNKNNHIVLDVDDDDDQDDKEEVQKQIF